MSLIGRSGETLSLEYVAQMTTTVGAHNLCPGHAKGAVLVPGDSSGDAVKVGRPAAAGAELVVGLVQRSIASGAGVDALLRVVLVKLASSGSLCTLLPQDTELL